MSLNRVQAYTHRHPAIVTNNYDGYKDDILHFSNKQRFPKNNTV